MKKITLFLTAMFMSLSLMACNANNQNANDDKATNNNTDTNEDQGMEENANNDGDRKLEVAQDAADRIMELDGVESANVIITDQNAYAAVVLDGDPVDNDETDTNTSDTENTDTNEDAGMNNDNDSPEQMLSPDLEDKIADKVREANDEIENVYVSLNPDFVERMTGYVDQINAGEPVEGFFGEFTEAIQRVFPDAH